ncbi:hypothetical protein RDV64_11040 [Acuticoccus sp. MNP-M23]|uniref:hypothetical protein n=1 Tax=Acuticoccus sp. MNP-M23 TaxID=3072793 RepID=UPI00281599BD|nr:hypothetical protein [Acuticoccus sp. MNP-M23]WMS44883.1 hypothetical protein RDV64_11040 [Acuticoccus sp. MNP-M23]
MVRAIALAVMLVWSSVAAADEKPRWFADVGTVGAFAKWGIPETDAVGFEVVCVENERVRIRPALFAVEEPAAMPDIRFQVDGEPYLRSARLDFSERDGAWQASSVLSKNDALVDAMRRGSKLTYDFSPPLRQGDAFTISLSGSAKAIDAALDGC